MPAFVKPDGDCLFASLACLAYNSKDKEFLVHYTGIMRERLIAHVLKDFEYFQNWTTSPESTMTRVLKGVHEPDPFKTPQEYEQYMSTRGTYGGTAELLAFVESFSIPVTVVWKRTGKYAIQRRCNLNERNETGAVQSRGDRIFLLFSGSISQGHFQPLLPPPLPYHLKPRPRSSAAKCRKDRCLWRVGKISVNKNKQRLKIRNKNLRLGPQ